MCEFCDFYKDFIELYRSSIFKEYTLYINF